MQAGLRCGSPHARPHQWRAAVAGEAPAPCPIWAAADRISVGPAHQSIVNNTSMDGGDLQAASQANRDAIEQKLGYVLATTTPGRPPRLEEPLRPMHRPTAALPPPSPPPAPLPPAAAAACASPWPCSHPSTPARCLRAHCRPEVEAASLARDLASHAAIRRRLPLLVRGRSSHSRACSPSKGFLCFDSSQPLPTFPRCTTAPA